MVTFDEAKRQANIRDHGFDFEGAYGELRLQTLGLWDGVVVMVVHTPRGDDDHIISIRKANRHEARNYWQSYPG